MLPLTWYICTAQKLIFKKCVWDFSHAYGVWAMHICIEIIFSELNFRVCQIYKYHYCKDIFLEIDFWHSLFQFHFSHLCHQHSFGLVFSNAFVFSTHVSEIELFRCLVQILQFGNDTKQERCFCFKNIYSVWDTWPVKQNLPAKLA